MDFDAGTAQQIANIKFNRTMTQKSNHVKVSSRNITMFSGILSHRGAPTTILTCRITPCCPVQTRGYALNGGYAFSPLSGSTNPDRASRRSLTAVEDPVGGESDNRSFWHPVRDACRLRLKTLSINSVGQRPTDRIAPAKSIPEGAASLIAPFRGFAGTNVNKYKFNINH